MARSKRLKKKTGTTPSALIQILPERFYTPELSEDLLGSLRAYLRDLEGWTIEMGVRPDNARVVALQIMAEIGTSPAEWYRQTMETPT